MNRLSTQYANALISKIQEKRLEYFAEFSTSPNYIILPYGCVSILKEQGVYYTNHFNAPDTYWGMEIIVSRACKDLDDIAVY